MNEFADQSIASFQIMINNEVNLILADNVFRRSPVLAKLLRFLADETIYRPHKKLKSYTIAVDVLGRPESFDPATDSSARVQMARLRKALESYYAHHGPADDHCLYLQPGSFKVRLGTLAEAYPALYRTWPDAKVVAAEPEPQAIVAQDIIAFEPMIRQKPINLLPRRPQSFSTIPMFAVMALLCIGLAAGIWFAWPFISEATAKAHRPVLELLPVENADKPEHAEDARIVANSLANDLPRFYAASVRLINTETDSRPSVSGEKVYRLATRIETNTTGGKILLVRLIDASTEISLWSSQSAFNNFDELQNYIIPLSGEINSLYGKIAQYEQVYYKNIYKGGYACLLRYVEFSEIRETANEEKIYKCLKENPDEERLQSTVLAARSMFTIERSSAQLNFDAAIKEAEVYAREAIAINPDDATANYALARLSYYKNDCVSARYYTDRSIDNNPKNMMIMSNIAALAPLCNYTKANELLDKAVIVQSPNYPKGRLLLAISAYLLSRPEIYDKIKASDVPQSRSGRINYYLTESLIAGAKGQRQLAARNWRRFAIMQPPQNRSADDLLKPLITTKPMRQRIIAFLEEAGALGQHNKGGENAPQVIQ